jgi:hypothetical protein
LSEVYIRCDAALAAGFRDFADEHLQPAPGATSPMPARRVAPPITGVR